MKKYDSNEVFVCNRVNLQKVYKIIRQERLLKVLQWENGEWQNAQKKQKNVENLENGVFNLFTLKIRKIVDKLEISS